MNYILHFQPKTEGKSITLDQIKEYFGQRAGYTVNEYQSLYSNSDTDVFFTFEYGGRRTSPSSSASEILPVYFNIASGKPHIFVLEAETELAEFIHTFNLLVSDLAMKGGGYVEYDEMAFYRGWNQNNEAFYHENGLNQPVHTLPSLPVELMEKCWRWNYHISEMHAELGEAVFVPKIMLIESASAFSTAVVWTDAQAIALPRVDKVILYRRAIAHGFRLNKKEDIALLDFTTLEPVLAAYPHQTEFLEYFSLLYKEAPENIKRLVQSQKAVSHDSLKFIPFSQVHDRELLAKIEGQR
jgi:hypothetical protein